MKSNNKLKKVVPAKTTWRVLSTVLGNLDTSTDQECAHSARALKEIVNNYARDTGDKRFNRIMDSFLTENAAKAYLLRLFDTADVYKFADVLFHVQEPSECYYLDTDGELSNVDQELFTDTLNTIRKMLDTDLLEEAKRKFCRVDSSDKTISMSTNGKYANILTCPYCNSQNVDILCDELLDRVHATWHIRCNTCGLHTPKLSNLEKAMTLWDKFQSLFNDEECDN